MPEHMSPAEVAALRTLMGLSQTQLAEALDRNPRVTRAWETGEYRIGAESIDRLLDLRRLHDQLVSAMVDADAVVVIPNQPGEGDMPRGWYLAAAGRAIAMEPDLMVEWYGYDDGDE